MIDDFFKSVIDMDRASIVICDTDHIILYMNPPAVRRYMKSGGEKLVGTSVLECHNERSKKIINRVLDWFRESTDNNMIYSYKNEKENKDVYIVALRDDKKNLIGYYEKHEFRDPESAGLYDFEKSL